MVSSERFGTMQASALRAVTEFSFQTTTSFPLPLWLPPPRLPLDL